jgi:4-diphosphocytidyl-2-C-methyl-D-erythritol kinase
MVIFPHCKINLGLDILEKRSDGFHNIESVFYPIKMLDALEVVKSYDDKTTFVSSGKDIPSDGNSNLCLRAYNLLKCDFDIPNVKIHLHKNIPIGAGLGGGSSDAAFTLKLLNEIFSLKISNEKLMEYAAKLGSDCAFFIQDKPMLASSRGEVLNSLSLDLKGYYLLLILPPIHISTAFAYSNVTPYAPDKQISEIIKKPIEEWRIELKNDFESSIFEKFPSIKIIKQSLYDNGAVYASMSGSGSVVYGIFKKKPKFNCAAIFKDCNFWGSQL